MNSANNCILMIYFYLKSIYLLILVCLFYFLNMNKILHSEVSVHKSCFIQQMARNTKR